MPVKFVFNNRMLDLWMLFHQTYNSLFKCGEKELAKLGITTQQYVILMTINNGGEMTTPTQLADWLDRNANSITLIIDRMEKAGLVKRVRDVSDRRSLRIVLTDKGGNILNKGTKIAWELIQNLLSGFSDKEMQNMINQMVKLRSEAISRCYTDKTVKDLRIDLKGMPGITGKAD